MRGIFGQKNIYQIHKDSTLFFEWMIGNFNFIINSQSKCRASRNYRHKSMFFFSHITNISWFALFMEILNTSLNIISFVLKVNFLKILWRWKSNVIFKIQNPDEKCYFIFIVNMLWKKIKLFFSCWYYYKLKL